VNRTPTTIDERYNERGDGKGNVGRFGTGITGGDGYVEGVSRPADRSDTDE